MRYTGRTISVLISFILLLIFTSINANASAPIKVGVFENSPIVFKNMSGNYDGPSIHVLNYIAKQDDWGLEFIEGSWEECLENLGTGEFDTRTRRVFTSESSGTYCFTEEVHAGFLFKPFVSSQIQQIIEGALP